MMRILLSLVFSVFLSIYLTACGFHVRNTSNLPPQLKTIYLDNSNERSNLTGQLEQNLQELGVHVVSLPNQAPVTLAIISDAFSQTSGALGTAQQLNTVTINYNVTFVLRDKNQKNIIAPISINSNTSYVQSASDIFGDTTAIPSLEQGLTRDMIEKILAYLDATKTRTALAAPSLSLSSPSP